MEALFYQNGTTLSTNHEISIRGMRIREIILGSKLAVQVLNQTVMELNHEISQCQWRLNGLNETVLEQKEIIQQTKERLDKLRMECFGKNGLHPDQCSGHGECVQEDQCDCVDGWSGNECEYERFTWQEIVLDQRPETRRYPSLQKYEDSLWLFGGRFPNTQFTNQLWQFHTKNQTWSLQTGLETVPDDRNAHSAVVYEDAMWIFGGTETSGTQRFFDDLWAFSFSSRSWIEKHTVGGPHARFLHSAVVYQNTMWIFGGHDGGALFRNDLWKYEITNSWTNIDIAGPSGRRAHVAVVYQDTMWLFGGNDGQFVVNDSWKLNMTLPNWEEVYQTGSIPAIWYSAAVVYQDAMWVFGGSNDTTTFHNQLSKFDFVEQSWELINARGVLPVGRICQSHSLHEGMLWIFGGHHQHDVDDFWRILL